MWARLGGGRVDVWVWVVSLSLWMGEVMGRTGEGVVRSDDQRHFNGERRTLLKKLKVCLVRQVI